MQQTSVTLLVEDPNGALTVFKFSRGPNPVRQNAVVTAGRRARRAMLPQALPATAAAPAQPITHVFEVQGDIHYFFFQELMAEAEITVVTASGQLVKYTLTTAVLQLDVIRRSHCISVQCKSGAGPFVGVGLLPGDLANGTPAAV